MKTPSAILRKKTCAERLDVSTRTVDRWASDPKYSHLAFPKPVPLGTNSVGFIEEEISDWIQSRAAMRGQPADAG